ncbi:MAG: response regulator [Gammaproteobacteria bacterium]|nr:response regulator [Gammaproteobacteria bacterium]
MSAKNSILIVDDDPMLRKTLTDILMVKHYTPIAVAQGMTALEKAREKRPAVALIDLNLEDMFGLDVLSGIKKCSPDTESIVLTGHATQNSAIEAINLGAYGYLQKPYDMDQLLLTIRRAIEKQDAEEALREERTLLAQRVMERTAELSLANAELARAGRLKDEFLANMSHELRTPLNAILNVAEALQDKNYGPLNELQRKYLSVVESSGRHLLSLINDILDLSKIEAGKFELLLGSITIEEVYQSCLMFVQQAAFKKRIKMSTNFDCAATVIQADPRRLKQILVNLLGNAIKFTPEGGKVGLETAADKQREAVHLSVWDTGIGISEADMKCLFQPFVQADASFARKYEGTGLGLALVRRLTELHGGSVSLESEPGKGTRFTVSLPWKAAAGDTEEDETGGRGSGKTNDPAAKAIKEASTTAPLILLIEDNEESILSISDHLKFKGYQIAVVRNGAEAIQQARERHPALILMDVQMPDMDGLKVTRQLRDDPDLADFPIIHVTTLVMPGDRLRCLEAGANEHLSKPISLKRLVKIIEAHI